MYSLLPIEVQAFFFWFPLTPVTALTVPRLGVSKVLYRPDGQHDGKLYSTHKHSIEVPIPRDGEYVVEVRAHSDGGDGVVSQVKISGRAGV